MKKYGAEQQSESFILSWVIDHKICDDLIDQYEKYKDGGVDSTDTYKGYKGITNHIMDKEIAVAYSKAVNDCILEYKKHYEWCGKSDSFLSSPYNVQKYTPANHYKVWHIEQGTPIPGKFIRELVFLTYLNDIEEGGGTEFMYQNLQVKPQKGLTIVWPAGWTHPHRGIVAPNETKYIATGWSCYPHRMN